MTIEESVIIDCSSLLHKVRQLFPYKDQPTELELLKRYRYKPYPDYITNFTKKLLNVIYNDDIEHNYEDILTFYDEVEYITNINKFVSMITILVNRNVDIDYIDVYCKKILTFNKNKLLVEFIVIKPIRNIDG